MGTSEVSLVWLVLHEREAAVRVGRKLLEERLVAGYNLMPVESAFWWKGKILEGQETLMLLKTTTENTRAIDRQVAEFTEAEVLDGFAVGPVGMSAPFEEWVKQETRPSRQSD
jgi:periplasmic divalent cation tolerance protein